VGVQNPKHEGYCILSFSEIDGKYKIKQKQGVISDFPAPNKA
jgi:hypothetical protein